MKKTNKFIFIIFLMVSCSFTTGLYEDILEAQELTKAYKFEDASKIYKKILDKKPSLKVQIKVNYQLAEILSIYLKKPKEAISYYEKVIKLSLDPLWKVKASEKIANTYFLNLKDYSKSNKYYQQLMNFSPRLKNYDYYKFQSALSYLNGKKYSESEVILKELIASESVKKTESYHQLGLIKYYNREYDQAINYWFEYLKLEKDKRNIIQVKYLIANAYESKEELKKAYNIYYSLLGEYPNPEVLRERLKKLYQRRVARKR